MGISALPVLYAFGVWAIYKIAKCNNRNAVRWTTVAIVCSPYFNCDETNYCHLVVWGPYFRKFESTRPKFHLAGHRYIGRYL